MARGIYQTRCIRVTGISLCLHYLDHQIGCCTGRAAARKWPVVVTVAWSRGLDRDTAALRSGSDPASGRPGSSCSLAVGGTDWWQALRLASESASATLNVPATECDSCRCRPGDVTGRRDANSVALRLTDRD